MSQSFNGFGSLLRIYSHPLYVLWRDCFPVCFRTVHFLFLGYRYAFLCKSPRRGQGLKSESWHEVFLLCGSGSSGDGGLMVGGKETRNAFHVQYYRERKTAFLSLLRLPRLWGG
jgi:hypothetical protein